MMVMMVFVLTWKQLISDDNDGDDGFCVNMETVNL